MKRIQIAPRADWQKIIAKQGLVYLSEDLERANPDEATNQTPWREDAAWEFTRDETVQIAVVTAQLYQMCLRAVDRIVKDPALMDRMGVSRPMQEHVRGSWQTGHPALYSRFDLARHVGDGQIKMVEINGDTPTGLVESALIQWGWLEQVMPELAHAEEPGQFNTLHEDLISRWREIADKLHGDCHAVFSARTDFLDDVLTTEYLRDLATQGGLETHLCDIRDVTLYTNPNGTKRFGTPQREVLRTWFKLYPWEWLLAEEFGADLIAQLHQIRVIEPPWKLLLSNKAILAVLWEMFPDHPNLMPAFFEKSPTLGSSYVEKPQYGRESTGVKLIRDGAITTTESATSNPLKDLPPIYQGLIEIAPQDGYYPLFGSWLVNDGPAGMMVREDTSPIISGFSRIVPHYYR